MKQLFRVSKRQKNKFVEFKARLSIKRNKGQVLNREDVKESSFWRKNFEIYDVFKFFFDKEIECKKTRMELQSLNESIQAIDKEKLEKKIKSLENELEIMKKENSILARIS